jgi:hypothetical protein
MRVLTDPKHISQHEDETADPFAFYRVTYQIQPSVCCQNLILFVLEEGERNNIYRSTDEVNSFVTPLTFDASSCCSLILTRRVINSIYILLFLKIDTFPY